MDRTDRQIIRELQANARQTNNELAERIHLSPSPCLRRVRNLEKAGIIQGYTAIVDHEAYGLPISVFASIRIEKHSEENVRAFETAIAGIDEILECYLMAGTSDYMLHIVADSLTSYERFMKTKLHRIPGLASIESNFAIGTIKRRRALPSLAHFRDGG